MSKPIRLYNFQKSKKKDSKLFISIGLQRSGQHYIIDWICKNLRNTIHFNNCIFKEKEKSQHLVPITGRFITYEEDSKFDSKQYHRSKRLNKLPDTKFNHLLYSLEDFDLNSTRFKNIVANYNPTIIFILRDPFNWLASSIKHGRSDFEKLNGKKTLLIQYLQQAQGKMNFLGKANCIFINYNRFVIKKSYQRNIAKSLGFTLNTIMAQEQNEILNFGGGSSFIGTNESQDIHKDVFARWKIYEKHKEFNSIIQDPKLLKLSKSYFKNLEGMEEINKTFYNGI